MRRKLEAQDYLGVIEAMRASSRAPPRLSGGAAAVAKQEVGRGDGGVGWAPTEETYGLALEACGKVRKRWGFKAPLFLIQEMRDVNLEISLVHYRGAVTACALTRQLSGVLPLLDEMRDRGVAADVVKRALGLVQMMRSEGLAPTAITYNVLLRLCGLGGCWATGLELMGMMEDEGITPNPYHYNSMFMALERGERWREAAELFRKMRACGTRPNALTYAPLIGVMDRCNKQDMAGAVLKEMLRESPRDSTREYNLLLNACAKARKWEHAQLVFEDMKKKAGVKPDNVTYNTVINALGRCGRVKEATVHLHAMKEQGLSPDVVTFGTLIHACAQSAKREPALALFAELVSRGLKPNLEAYKGCIVSCHKTGHYQQGLDLFNRMLADKVRMDRVVFNTAIACCAQLKLWRRGVAMLDEMRERKVAPDQYSYNSAIYGCVKAQQSQQMTMVLARMREDGFDPDVWTYSNLIRCLADSMLWRRAVGILDDMLLEGRVQPDAHCFNAAVRACSKVGEWAEAERLVTGMRGQGLAPDKYTYNSLIYAYGNSGEWEKALSMLEEIRAAGFKVNCMAYSAAIKACDKAFQWERALELLDRMVERGGVKPNLFAYNHAMSACVRFSPPYSRRKELHGEGGGQGAVSPTSFCVPANLPVFEAGIPGDWYSNHALLEALGRGGRWEEAVKTFEDKKRQADRPPEQTCYKTMLRVCERAGFACQAVEYLKEMPAAGVPPTLSHFKQALKACERATSRGLTGGRGDRSTSASSRSSGSAASSSSLSGEGGGRHGWESGVAAAVAAVPVILELVREMTGLSPDDDCYSSAMRACQNAGMGDAGSELMDDLQAQSAVRRMVGGGGGGGGQDGNRGDDAPLNGDGL
ncbi:conserved unknown protein [Ectocarpus siliculosus]|uniref:PROP1-like PPR domain-containing protein n=1 Tax=Ectocarpus siliculosus TaxID=2880 RepID=D7FY15_ECTSI|nr:conserved unknown protein [Ectocarpus siliculosus]|eukprot:CBJ32428.1 conserved unknown protein [Ectocarpus siliculosus]